MKEEVLEIKDYDQDDLKRMNRHRSEDEVRDHNSKCLIIGDITRDDTDKSVKPVLLGLLKYIVQRGHL